MDFEDTTKEAAFRTEVRAWLRANAPSLTATENSPLQSAKAWQALKFDAGYGAISWPKACGGRDGTPMEAVIFQEEERRHCKPIDVFAIGIGMCLPTVSKFGTDAHRSRYLRKGLRGEEIWCQLFSEPAAGSDLAAIRTRAVREGEVWRIDGQKVWTSGAQFSDFGILIARTDPTVPKHKGLGMFIVDMHAPGVSVRPIRQLNGQADFNEVFFANVEIRDADRLGEPGEGWRVAMTTLMHERQAVNDDLGLLDFDDLLRLSREHSLGPRTAIEDQRIRERIVDLYINSRALRLLSYRARTLLSKGQTPGPELSIGKLAAAAQGQRASYLAMDIAGQEGCLTSAELGADWVPVEHSWAWGTAFRIAGGTDEILRNVIAERVLGLPPDVRIDKDLPFNQLNR